MPRNVAVNQPATRVVETKRDRQEAMSGQHSGIAARRVLQVERFGGTVPWMEFLREDPEIVAVEVDGMGDSVDGVRTPIEST